MAPNGKKAEGVTGITAAGEVLRVREVFQDNLEEEFALIRDAVETHPLVAMDSEFPGVVARPVGNFKSSREYHYKALKMNVDMLKLIQLGLTLTDANGNLPRHQGELCVWQFNFKGFRLADDVYAQDSIELLKQSGIDFAQNEARGIEVQRFGELLMTSGIVLNEDIRWITFHRCDPRVCTGCSSWLCNIAMLQVQNRLLMPGWDAAACPSMLSDVC
jgi:CCR4-NOT transcription complex subunit 7/8